jgi:hypothetical protein
MVRRLLFFNIFFVGSIWQKRVAAFLLQTGVWDGKWYPASKTHGGGVAGYR